MSLFSFFNKKTKTASPPLEVDMHSHLLPGLDDGVESIEEALEVLSRFAELGFRKVITTPHIMQDFYPNEKSNIIKSFNELKSELDHTKITIELEAAAEYFLDEFLIKKLESKDDLLLFGESYILFETSFINEPINIKDFIFKARSAGLNPVLAHPERYAYLNSNFKLAEELKERGVLFQVNINSIGGYYSKPVRKMAEQLIKRKMVDFIASDCHNIDQLEYTRSVFENKYFIKALSLPLHNYKLMDSV